MASELTQLNIRLPGDVLDEINNLAVDLAAELGLPRLTQADVVCLGVKRLRSAHPAKKIRKKNPESS